MNIAKILRTVFFIEHFRWLPSLIRFSMGHGIFKMETLREISLNETLDGSQRFFVFIKDSYLLQGILYYIHNLVAAKKTLKFAT